MYRTADVFVVGLIVAASQRDHALTRSWAQRAADAYDVELGRGSPHAAQMVYVVETPALFPSWGQRGRTFE